MRGLVQYQQNGFIALRVESSAGDEIYSFVFNNTAEGARRFLHQVDQSGVDSDLTYFAPYGMGVPSIRRWIDRATGFTFQAWLESAGINYTNTPEPDAENVPSPKNIYVLYRRSTRTFYVGPADADWTKNLSEAMRMEVMVGVDMANPPNEDHQWIRLSKEVTPVDVVGTVTTGVSDEEELTVFRNPGGLLWAIDSSFLENTDEPVFNPEDGSIVPEVYL